MDSAARTAKEEGISASPVSTNLSPTATHSGFHFSHSKTSRVLLFCGIPSGKPTGQKESCHLSSQDRLMNNTGQENAISIVGTPLRCTSRSAEGARYAGSINRFGRSRGAFTVRASHRDDTELCNSFFIDCTKVLYCAQCSRITDFSPHLVEVTAFSHDQKGGYE